MDRDGSPLHNETGETVWKEFPPTNNSHVLPEDAESKDHVTE